MVPCSLHRPAAPASRGPPSSFGVGGVGVEGGRAQWREAGVAGGGERDLRLRKAARGGELLCVLRVCVA